MDINKVWNSWRDATAFSGVFAVADGAGKAFAKCQGYRNRNEALPVNLDTAFAIASGTKLFTGLAVCKLMKEKKLCPADKLWDVLPYDLKQIDRSVTIHQLLTHTSGIGDYLDEELPDPVAMEQALCDTYPVYHWERLEYYLQMITHLPPKFPPGTRYGYSNAGYVMLGLAIEAASGVPYQQYISDAIFRPLSLRHTGFYRADDLPANTARGYLENGRSNVFSLPVIGGADGGLYTCAADLDALWRAIFDGRVLSEPMLQTFLHPHAAISDDESYGYGVYIQNGVYYATGGDFGVDFFTAYLPESQMTVSALGNMELNTYPLLSAFINQ